MSSFIVTPETIDDIVTFLWDHANDNEDIDNYPIARVMKECPFKDKNELANKLLEMNYKAYNQRYGENRVSPGMVYAPLRTSPEQALKSMKCLLYQASEGDVPNDPLYKFLEKAAEATKNYIIEKLPAYQNAEWNIIDWAKVEKERKKYEQEHKYRHRPKVMV